MRILLAAMLLAGCTQTVDQVRTTETSPRAVIEAASYDALTGCIGEKVAGKYRMNYAPTPRGGAYLFTTYGMGGTSSILIDVIRGAPARAEVRFTGGPWVGQDDDVIRRVKDCAN